MAKPKRKRAKRIKLDHQLTVEVEPAPFHLNKNLALLDCKRIEKRSRARVEVGYVDTGCCRAAVHAVVRKGMVVAVEIERASGSKAKRMAPELQKLVKQVVKRVAPAKKSSPSLPIPLAKLATAKAGSFETWTCVRICFPFFGGFCVTCCSGKGPGKAGPWSICSSSFQVATLG